MISLNRALSAFCLLAALSSAAFLRAQPVSQTEDARGPLGALVGEVLSKPPKALLGQSLPPGIGGAIVLADGRIEIGVAGLRRFGEPEPILAKDVWHLGSCTKALTAVLAARCVEEDKLRFDASLAAVLFALDEGVKSKPLAQATLMQLLQHRSGLLANLPPAVMLQESIAAPFETTIEGRRARLREALLADPSGKIGSDYRYSNLGYIAAGSMIEAALGEPYEVLLEREILRPLGIPKATFGPPGRGQEPLDAIVGHRWSESTWHALRPRRGSDNPAIMSAAGRLALSLEDWGKTIVPWLNPEREVPGFPSPKMRKALLEPFPGEPNYAAGWLRAKREWGQGYVWTHSGSNTYWYAVVWMAPARGFAVLATANAGASPAPELADHLCGLLIERATKAVK